MQSALWEAIQQEQVLDLRPPRWFRYGIIAGVMLILCSCQALEPKTGMPSAQPEVSRFGTLPQGEFPTAAVPTREVTPVLYQADLNEPPPIDKQIAYRTGVALAQCQYPCGNAGCPCGACGSCQGDGLTGPRDEYLCDGGDHGLPAGVKADWQISGLEQEDTVAHYDTPDGRTIITPSNQVCIYAPRFGAVRRVIDLHEYARYDSAIDYGQTVSLALADEKERPSHSINKLKPSIDRGEDPLSILREREQLGELGREQRLAEDVGTLAPYADLQIVQTGTLTGEERAKIARSSLAAVTWTGDEAPQITVDSRNAVAAVSEKQPGVVYHLEEPQKPCLRLLKLASSGSAQPGEEIEFTLRVDNLGNRPLDNIAVVDNLTTRLEYVPDSAKASVAAEFSSEPNTGGSEVLRWELTEPLPAGEGCILQFKCKVR